MARRPLFNPPNLLVLRSDHSNTQHTHAIEVPTNAQHHKDTTHDRSPRTETAQTQHMIEVPANRTNTTHDQCASTFPHKHSTGSKCPYMQRTNTDTYTVTLPPQKKYTHRTGTCDQSAPHTLGTYTERTWDTNTNTRTSHKTKTPPQPKST